MTTRKPEEELTALAAEVADLWQEHLSGFVHDPAARAELMKLLEPSRALFAGWAGMVQNGAHGTGTAPFPQTHAAGTASGTSADAPKTNHTPETKMGTKAASAAFDDGALRLAQLAVRLGDLEKRVARLEDRPAGKAAKSPRAPAKRTKH